MTGNQYHSILNSFLELTNLNFQVNTPTDSAENLISMNGAPVFPCSCHLPPEKLKAANVEFNPML